MNFSACCRVSKPLDFISPDINQIKKGGNYPAFFYFSKTHFSILPGKLENGLFQINYQFSSEELV
jgi:hypothetical protein